MAVTTAAVIGTVGAIGSAVDQRNARRDAARDQSRANIESADILAEAGREAEADLLRSQAAALDEVAAGVTGAEERIQPFVQPGQEAFRQAQESILSGADVGGPLAESIRQASLGGVPSSFDTSGPVGQEISRQADLSVSGATPIFRQGLLTSGLQGIAATGDVGGIRQRGFERAGDIVGGTAAQRASALVGQAPQLAQLSTGAQEGRLLGDVAGQQFTTTAAEQLARLAGRVS